MPTKEEFNDMRSAEQGEDVEISTPHNTIDTGDMSARDFIMGRGKEIIKVPISGADGAVMFIGIRARLNKRDIKEHQGFLNLFKDPESLSEDEANKGASKFLAAITLDPGLDEAFWNNEELDSYIAQELLTAFMEQAAKSLEGVKKFRK